MIPPAPPKLPKPEDAGAGAFDPKLAPPVPKPVDGALLLPAEKDDDAPPLLPNPDVTLELAPNPPPPKDADDPLPAPKPDVVEEELAPNCTGAED